MVTAWQQKKVLSYEHGAHPDWEGKMSLSQATFEAPTWAAEFALVKDELLLAVRRHVVVDALFSFALIVLPMVGLVLAMLLLGTDASTGADETAMLTLPF